MPPLDHALVAVDAQADVVLAAGGGLRHGERAARAVVRIATAPTRSRPPCGPGTSAPTSAATRVTASRPTNDARCCAWQPIALMTSAWPLRAGRGSSARRLFCGPSSTRVAIPALDVLDLHEPQRAERAVAHEVRARSASSGTRCSRARPRTVVPAGASRATRSRACAKSCVTGLSQTTSRPASSAAAANG